MRGGDMQCQFKVWKDAELIYNMAFPTDENWQPAEYSKVALADFHKTRTEISLTDLDLSMNCLSV
jgi:hypothetical protein